MIRTALRGLVVARSRGPAACNGAPVLTGTRSFCEAKPPKPVSRWIEATRNSTQWGASHVTAIATGATAVGALWLAFETRRGGDEGAARDLRERLNQENPVKVRPLASPEAASPTDYDLVMPATFALRLFSNRCTRRYAEATSALPRRSVASSLFERRR